MDAKGLSALLRRTIPPHATIAAILLVLCLSSMGTATTSWATPLHPGLPESSLAAPQLRATAFVGNWTEGTDYGALTGDTGAGGIPIDNNACVSNETYIYCVGGRNFQTGQGYSNVYWANVSAGGVIGPWNETIDYGATSGTTGAGGYGVVSLSCVEWDAMAYCVGGANDTGKDSRVYYAPLYSHGVGPWTETIDYGATSGTTGAGGVSAPEPVCAATGGYIYCVSSQGGSSSTYYAQLLSTGVGPWTEGTDYGAASGSTGTGGLDTDLESCAANGSYLYCAGGLVHGKTTSAVFYAYVSPYGIGAWNETTDLNATSGSSGAGGTGVYETSCFVAQGHLVCVGGQNNTLGSQGFVYTAAVSSAGVGPWSNTVWYFENDFAPAHLGPFATYGQWCMLLKALGLGVCTGGGISYTETAHVGVAPPPPVKASPTLATALSVGSVAIGGTFTDSATLTGATASAGGSVTYTLYSDGACTTATTQTSTKTVVNAAVPTSGAFTAASFASTMSVLAVYTGDANNNGAAAACEPITVLKNSPSLATTLSVASVLVGGTFTDSATLTGATTNAGGTVTYTLNTGKNCGAATGATDVEPVTNAVVPSSTAFTAVTSASGYDSISATYSGDANNNAVSALCEPIALATNSPTLATTLSASTVVVGGTFTDSATLTGATSNAGGTVTYALFADAACSVETSQSSQVTVSSATVPSSASFTAVTATAGYNSVLATYSGDLNNAGVAAACEKIAVTAAVGKVTVASDVTTSSVAVGGTFTAQATLTGATSNAGGTVTYTLYADGTCTTATTQSSKVTVANAVVPASSAFTAVSSSSGYNSVLAVYSGDANNNAATAPCVKVAVTTVSSGAKPLLNGQQEVEVSLLVLVAILLAVVVVWRLRTRMRGSGMEEKKTDSASSAEKSPSPEEPASADAPGIESGMPKP